MTEIEVHKKLSAQAPTDFRLNELIAFSYPMRKLRVAILVNKRPDTSLTNFYASLMGAVKLGFDVQATLFEYLGLGNNDEFVLRELFFLREKGYLDLISERWIVTPDGEDFLLDNRILRVEEEEDFDFLLDEMSGDIISAKENRTSKIQLDRKLEPESKIPRKSPSLIESKFQEIADVYKHESLGKSYLISFNPNEIIKDYEEVCNYWLVEYIPQNKRSSESKLEVRSHDNLKVNKSLSSKFNSEYRHFIYSLSHSDRYVVEEISPILESTISDETVISDFTPLSIWETKQKFVEALSSVNKKILIESPWIKKATLEYIPLIEKLLETKREVVILYGIGEKDEHDISTVRMLETLQSRYSSSFKLIHLPSHFRQLRSKLTGTHRKLVIKDDDYYILGSFNFLSFGKNENDKVANEESMVITKGVSKKWEQVYTEYSIGL